MYTCFLLEAGNSHTSGDQRAVGVSWIDRVFRNATITYPKMEHLAKLLHHAMKTALFPLFFLPSCN